MNLKSKVYLENHKQAAESALAARLAYLQGKGFDDRAVERNPSVRRIKADIRKAMVRLERIAALETANVERAQAKADKLATKEKAREKGSAETTKEAAAKKPKTRAKPAPTPEVSTTSSESSAPAPEASTAEPEAPAPTPEVSTAASEGSVALFRVSFTARSAQRDG